MTLEELSVVYSADVQPALDAIRRLMQVLTDAGNEAECLSGDFYRSGAMAGEGLAQGIQDSRDKVVSAAREVAQAAAEALKNALSIHSPSRVTEEVGLNFTSGLTNGMLSAAQPALEAASLLVSLPAQNELLNDQPRSAAQPLQITVPIEVDGYQLGVAALEGIHRVSRITGRAELSL